MNTVDTSQVVGINFSDLFGEDSSDISMERVEAFLKKAVNYTSERSSTNPNQLVRVVHGKKVMWMTQTQADKYLSMESDEDQMQKDVEQALRGGLQYIRQELEILLALAIYTFNQFKEQQLVNQKDIDRIGPSLQRRQAEINEGISETRESETVLEVKRRRNPLLDEYEELMGEFINAKSTGDMDAAMELAKKLAEKKKYYLLLARGIEPDVRTIYYHRMNLQKTKKRILNTQGELCNSRKDALKLEITEIQDNLDSIKEQMQTADEDGVDSASLKIQTLDIYDLESKEKELNEKASELKTLDTESKIIEKKEAETEAVIEHIQEDVLQEADTKVDMNDLKKTQRKSPQKPQQHQSSVAKQKRTGMHTRKRS